MSLRFNYYYKFVRMGIKVARAATIWKFLGDLQRFIISPQKYEVMQLDNNKRIRRNKKATSVVSEAAIRTQEERLTRGEITPMQFLQFMSHKVESKPTVRSAEGDEEGDEEGDDDDGDDDDVDHEK